MEISIKGCILAAGLTVLAALFGEAMNSLFLVIMFGSLAIISSLILLCKVFQDAYGGLDE